MHFQSSTGRTTEEVPAGGSLLSAASFLRMLHRPFTDVVAELDCWWQRQEQDGAAWIDPHTRIGRVCLESGTARLTVTTTDPWRPFKRSVPMVLELTPWTDGETMTRLELTPRRRVRPTRRYFNAGHRALNSLVSEVTAA
jgi:hypothetical protein